MLMTLGTYLKNRREAALLSLDDVAERFATEPRYARHVRADWLALIEADAADPSFMTIAVLGAIYPIDMQVLVALAAPGRHGLSDAICAGCGCSERSPCIDQISLTLCTGRDAGRCSHCHPRADMLIATMIA